MEHRDRWLGVACAVGVLTIWTGFNLAARAGVSGGLRPLELAFLRFAVAGLAVLPWVMRGSVARLGLGRAVALAATAGLGFSLFAYSGFAYSPASHAAALMAGTVPLFAALLAIPLLGEWPRGALRLAGLSAITAAVPLMLWDSVAAAPGQLFGDLLFLGGGFVWSVFTVLLRRWRVNPLDATAAVYSISAVIFLPVYLALAGFTLPALGWRELVFQAAYQGAISTVISMLMFTRAVAILGPGSTAMITAFVPAAAALAAIPLLGEIPTLRTWVGIAAASIGVALAVAALRPSGNPRSA